jgi:hypothetical protein
MGYWLGRGLSAKGLSQAFRGSSSPPTSRIRLGKTFLAGEAAKASFIQNEFDLILSQCPIPLLSCSCIMDFYAGFLTIWADRLVCPGDHLDSNAPVFLPFLLENVQFRQAQWDNDSLSFAIFFCGMLAWQGLFSLTECFYAYSVQRGTSPFLLPSLLFFLLFPPKVGEPEIIYRISQKWLFGAMLMPAAFTGFEWW